MPQGGLAAVSLGPDEYFVLGDNSPVSNDSRFWGEGPVVRGSMFVGKPFLVHLPGQVVPLRFLGGRCAGFPIPVESVTFVSSARRQALIRASTSRAERMI